MPRSGAHLIPARTAQIKRNMNWETITSFLQLVFNLKPISVEASGLKLVLGKGLSYLHVMGGY